MVYFYPLGGGQGASYRLLQSSFIQYISRGDYSRGFTLFFVHALLVTVVFGICEGIF